MIGAESTMEAHWPRFHAPAEMKRGAVFIAVLVVVLLVLLILAIIYRLSSSKPEYGEVGNTTNTGGENSLDEMLAMPTAESIQRAQELYNGAFEKHRDALSTILTPDELVKLKNGTLILIDSKKIKQKPKEYLSMAKVHYGLKTAQFKEFMEKHLAEGIGPVEDQEGTEVLVSWLTLVTEKADLIFKDRAISELLFLIAYGTKSIEDSQGDYEKIVAGKDNEYISKVNRFFFESIKGLTEFGTYLAKVNFKLAGKNQENQERLKVYLEFYEFFKDKVQ